MLPLRQLLPRSVSANLSFSRCFSSSNSFASMSSSFSSPFTRAVVSSMRALYPEALADKSFDNTGLLLEAPFIPTRRNRNSVLLTIDLTRAVADEAIQNSHSVVVAYHPIIFRGLKSLTLQDSQQQSLLRLAAHGVSVYCPHTAVDTVPGGMADWLCDTVTGKLDGSQSEKHSYSPSEPTRPFAQKTSKTSSTPPAATSVTTQSPSDSYRTYSTPSYPDSASSSHLTTKPHTRKVVTPSPSPSLDAANNRTSSPLYNATNTGAGRLITFPNSRPLTELIPRIAHAIGLPKGFSVAIPQLSSVEDIQITTVAVCPGSGASVLQACSPPPDLVLTGEMSHHETLAVTERGGCVVTLFHSNSERGYLWSVMRERLEQRVKASWKQLREELKQNGDGGGAVEELLEDDSVEVVVSERDRDPFGVVVLQEN